MLKLNTTQQRVPTGGHQFPSHGITFRGDKFQEVSEKLAEFRLNNNIPCGDPEQEILQYYADKWPWMVRRSDEVETSKEEADYVAWRQWIHATWRKPPVKYKVPKEAQERWNICLKCPHNKVFDFAKTEELTELKKRAFVLRKAVDTPENLGFCSCHKWDGQVAIFIDNAKINSNKNTGEIQPSNCWV